MNGYITVTADVKVSIDEFDDDDLIAEVRARGLIPKLLAASDETAPAKPIDIIETVGSIMRWLMARRQDKARSEMDELFAALVPRELRDADKALNDGRTADAICSLDRFLEPSPAATATMLPMKSKISEARA